MTTWHLYRGLALHARPALTPTHHRFRICRPLATLPQLGLYLLSNFNVFYLTGVLRPSTAFNVVQRYTQTNVTVYVRQSLLFSLAYFANTEDLGSGDALIPGIKVYFEKWVPGQGWTACHYGVLRLERVFTRRSCPEGCPAILCFLTDPL